MSNPVIIVVGAGPGVSGSVARRFSREGYDVGLLGLDDGQLVALTEELASEHRTVRSSIADVADEVATKNALTSLAESFGRVDVLHFNPSVFRQKDPLSLTATELLADVAVGVGGLLTSVQAVRPHLVEGGRVTVTGSMAAARPWSQAASLGVQKAGIRNLVHSLDVALEPHRIRAVSVTVQGSLSSKGLFTPDLVADAIYAAAHQDESRWSSEISYPG